MTDIKLNNNLQKRTLAQWLFNPFQFIAGGSALLLGLAIILIIAYINSLRNASFGKNTPLWFYYTYGLNNWLWISVTLYFAGRIISHSSLRAIDVLGTQALARAPYLLSALVKLSIGYNRFADFIISLSSHRTSAVNITPNDSLLFVIVIIICFLLFIWALVLMYRAYAISCNVKGRKAIVSFIVAFIVAEILSNLVFFGSLSLVLGFSAVYSR